MEDIMLNNKKLTNKELTLIRLKNMAQWEEEDFKFYEDINKELLEILQNSEIESSTGNHFPKK